MKFKKFIKSYPFLYVWAKDNKIVIKALPHDIPKEYITNVTTFKSINVNIRPSTLIPRVETEELVDLGVNLIKEKNLKNIADVGSGSGVIGISILKEAHDPNISMTFIEKSRKTLNILKENVKQNSFLKVSKVIQSDLLDYLKDDSENLPQLVLANLPYIPSRKVKQLPKSVIKFEPLLALDGGKDGLVLIKKLIRQIIKYKISYSIFEIYETHEAPLTRFLKENDIKSFKFIKDSKNNMRFLSIECTSIS